MSGPIFAGFGAIVGCQHAEKAAASGSAALSRPETCERPRSRCRLGKKVDPGYGPAAPRSHLKRTGSECNWSTWSGAELPA